jgi:hypothetical protein
VVFQTCRSRNLRRLGAGFRRATTTTRSIDRALVVKIVGNGPMLPRYPWHMECLIRSDVAERALTEDWGQMQPSHAEPNNGSTPPPQRARWSFPNADPHAGVPAAQQRETWHGGSERTLRTQLAVVKGFSQLLDRALQQRQDLDRVTGLSEQLGAHVAELEQLLLRYLAACRLRWDGVDLTWHAVDLAALTQQVASGFRDEPPEALAFATPALHLEPAQPVQGIWDARWLQEALGALISNALRYSPPDGSVVVTLQRDGDAHVRVAISDDGSGIMPDEHEQIFLPFVRGSAARNVPGGWGLGLFIAGRVAELHGGTIEVESAPGAGSVFTLRLPLFPPAASPRAPGPH